MGFFNLLHATSMTCKEKFEFIDMRPSSGER